jgi:hypothetical protein
VSVTATSPLRTNAETDHLAIVCAKHRMKEVVCGALDHRTIPDNIIVIHGSEITTEV